MNHRLTLIVSFFSFVQTSLREPYTLEVYKVKSLSHVQPFETPWTVAY